MTVVTRTLRFAPALVLIGLFAATDAHAVNVCGYRVKGALGFRCPVKTGATVCASVNANTGNDCQNTLLCFGGLLCQVKLIPFTGPQQACPFQSTRLRGFSCFAPIRFPTRPPTGTPTSTPTSTEIPFTPTGTPTGTAEATATVTTAPTATDTEEPEATPTDTVAPNPTATNTTAPESTATNTSIPPPSTATSTATEAAAATATATGTATGTAAATVTNTVAPPATATNTVGAAATSTNTVAPPATPTNTVAPPATATNTVAAQATSTNTVAPPATSTNTVAPPATSTNTVAPPATSTNTVAPPATSTNTVAPPATSTNTVAPPATSTSTVPPAATSTNTTVPSTATATRTNVPPTATATNTAIAPTATATATSTATTAPIVCPITAGRYTITQTTGGTLRVATFAAFPFPSGGTLIQDVDAGDSQCVHNSVIPFPNGLNVPLFCVPALGATTMVTQTGCGVGRIDSNGGSDFTIAENGDTSETTVCNVPQAVCPASGPAPDSSGRIDISVGNGMVDVCTGNSTANAAATVPVNTLTWVAADASCPDSDGMFNPETDTKLAEFPQTLDFTTDVTSARFTDISGDGCQKSGLGPNGPFTETGACIDLTAMTVTTVAAGTVFSSGGPTYDLLFSTKLPSTISGPAQSGGAVCGNPPTINFNGTATRCLVGP